jgi:large subunit ribosomal protein L30
MSEKQTTTGRRLRVTLVKSPIGYNASQAKVVQSLGLRRMHHTVEVADHPAMRGMLHKVRHLVRVEE